MNARHSEPGRRGNRPVPDRTLGRLCRLTCVVLAAACTERIALRPGAVEADAATGAEDAAASPPLVDDTDAALSRDGRVDASGCSESYRSASYRPGTAPVILSVDRSFSMFGKFGDTTRFAATQQTLRSAIKAFQGSVHFGYQEFPGLRGQCGANVCCAGPLEVFPGPNSYQAIDRAMRCDSVSSGCFDPGLDSPSFDALKKLREFYETLDTGDTPNRYIWLITDGDPSCQWDRMGGGPGACDRAIAEISTLARMGVKTLVVGVSDGAKNTTCLERMALAGNAPGPAAPFYYPAIDEAQLRQQLNDLARKMAQDACHITLRTSPANVDRVNVSLDGRVLPRDPSRKEGWNFDPDSRVGITFHGSACEKIQGSSVRIEVSAACSICPGLSGCR